MSHPKTHTLQMASCKQLTHGVCKQLHQQKPMHGQSGRHLSLLPAQESHSHEAIQEAMHNACAQAVQPTAACRSLCCCCCRSRRWPEHIDKPGHNPACGLGPYRSPLAADKGTRQPNKKPAHRCAQTNTAHHIYVCQPTQHGTRPSVRGQSRTEGTAHHPTRRACMPHTKTIYMYMHCHAYEARRMCMTARMQHLHAPVHGWDNTAMVAQKKRLVGHTTAISAAPLCRASKWSAYCAAGRSRKQLLGEAAAHELELRLCSTCCCRTTQLPDRLAAATSTHHHTCAGERQSSARSVTSPFGCSGC
jgi:hypothetical protein